MDPKPKSTSEFFEFNWFYLAKVLLAFKRKRFGRAWPGTFWLQAEALWLESFRNGFSLDGSVLLESVSKIYTWYILVKDQYVVWQFRGVRKKDNGHINDHEDNLSFQDESGRNQVKIIEQCYRKVKVSFIVRQFRGAIITFYSYSNNREDGFSFQDGIWKKSNEFIKCFYLMIRLLSGNILDDVHRGVASVLGGGRDSVLGGLGWRDDSGGEEGCHALIGNRVRVEELEEGGLVLKFDKGGALVKLAKVEVHPINLVGVHQPCFAQFSDSKLEIAIWGSLQTPDGQSSSFLLGLKSRAQQIKVWPATMKIGESGKNGNVKIRKRVYKFASYLATMGDFPLAVILYTFSIKTGGILTWRCRLRRVMRMSTSFSPGSLLGMAGPEKTKDLRIGNRNEVYGKNSFSPNNIGAIEGQESGVGVLLVFGDGPVEVSLAFAESLHLSIQVSNLLLKVGHGRLVVVDVMVISCQTGIFTVQVCTGPIGEENILVTTVLHRHIWFEGKKVSDVKRERVEVSCIKKGKMICLVEVF